MSESEDRSMTTRRVVMIGVAATIAALAALIPWALMRGGDQPPPTSAAVPSSTQPTDPTPPSSTTTSIAPDTPLTAAMSPFSNTLLVSTDAPIPDLPPVTSPAAEIYVDPSTGDDAAAGTITEPVATIEAAQRLARPQLRAGAGDVVVYLKGGIHRRADTLTLTFQDSGREDGRMVYRSYPGEQAILEGGVAVSGWQPAFDEVLVAMVPESVADVRQFFAAGQRQQRARTEEATGVAVRFVKGQLLDGTRNVAMVVDGDLVSNYAHPEDLELVYVGVHILGHGIERGNGTEILRPSWKAHRLPVESTRELGNGLIRLDISNGALHHASERGHEPMEILPSDPFFIENALELLDSPGEWYFDSRERMIYWWPSSPAAVDDAWIASTEVLLSIDGTLSRPVRNVAIEGIAFRHAGYVRPNEEGYAVSQAASWFTSWKMPDWMIEGPLPHSFVDRARPPGLPGAAVEIDSARDVTFTGNVFTELGAVGVLLNNDVRRISFDRNLFVDISAEALVAGHPEHEVIDEPTEGPVADIEFTNNVIDRAGAEFYASVGLMITKADGVTIANNLFRDLPYSAISLGWGWANNLDADFHRSIRVENNYFENVVNLLYDGAPIYLVGPVAEVGAARSEFTHIRGNFANNLGADPQFKAPTESVDPDFSKRPGIQLDAGVRNTLISNNVFTGSTAWLQVTAWPDNRNIPGWVEEIALTGTGNWSDTAESLPARTQQVGIAPAEIFDVASLPAAVVAIISEAGLAAGVELPPLPSIR